MLSFVPVSIAQESKNDVNLHLDGEWYYYLFDEYDTAIQFEKTEYGYVNDSALFSLTVDQNSGTFSLISTLDSDHSFESPFVSEVSGSFLKLSDSSCLCYFEEKSNFTYQIGIYAIYIDNINNFDEPLDGSNVYAFTTFEKHLFSDGNIYPPCDDYKSYLLINEQMYLISDNNYMSGSLFTDGTNAIFLKTGSTDTDLIGSVLFVNTQSTK